jgi:hypothetical protein
MKTQNRLNARFWAWWNHGWVKITLRPGQHLDISLWERTDEGHRSEAMRWVHTGWYVERYTWGRFRDCDGTCEETHSDFSTLDELAAVPIVDYIEPTPGDVYRGNLIRRPNWQELEPVKVYDQYAQLANY